MGLHARLGGKRPHAFRGPGGGRSQAVPRGEARAQNGDRGHAGGGQHDELGRPARGRSGRREGGGDRRPGDRRLWRGAGGGRPVGGRDAQAVPDLGDCIDRDPRFGRERLSQPSDAPVQRVLADDPALPAELRQLVTADRLPLRLVQRHQHLHDARLQGLNPVGAVHLERVGACAQAPEGERRRDRQLNAALRGREQLVHRLTIGKTSGPRPVFGRLTLLQSHASEQSVRKCPWCQSPFCLQPRLGAPPPRPFCASRRESPTPSAPTRTP
jgi:hypothetical protein